MSTLFIIGLVTLSLVVLVAVAITLQTIEKNNKEKRRLEAALKTRARNFQHMIEGFPEGFLNRDLRLLVCKCLQEVYGQLINLNPKNGIYSKNKITVDQQIEAIRNQGETAKKVHLTDPAQIKEIQKLLQSLYGFISKLNKSRSLTNDEAKAYGLQVRQLMVQSTLDALLTGVNDSIAKNKPRLAIHYLHMVLDKLNKENGNGHYSDKITQYKAQMAELEQAAIAQESRRKEADEEWDKVGNEEDGSWKKNAVYD